MSGLISRQAAIDALVKAIREDPYYDSNEAINGLGVCDVRVILNDLPSAQPEIIRCGDCKHYYFADNRIPQEQRYTCELDGDRWKPDDYCSFAVRRTNEEVD